MKRHESFGEELKKRRLERQVSLMDISAVTRINVKFLEAIEEGKFAVLPETYIRAFLREYAEAVGLDPAETLRDFEALQGDAAVPRSSPSSGPASAPRAPAASGVSALGGSAARTQALFLFGLLIVVVSLLMYILHPGSEETAVSSVQETPFDKVVEESMAALPAPQPAIPVTVTPTPAPPDTLVLQMQTTDSVWVLMVIDGSRTEELLFPPNRRHTWRGTSGFSVTLGNAGGATFRLNNRDLGTLGRSGAVVRNVPIGRSLLESSSPAP